MINERRKEMRQFKFRAWAEKTTNLAYKYAHEKAEEKYDLIEPQNREGVEWDSWYDEKDDYWHKMVDYFRDNNEAILVKENEMITNFKINDKLQSPYGYEILDTMQYSELNDINQTEIYEGDLVSVESFGNPIAEVKYIAKDGCWGLFHESFVSTVCRYKRLTQKNIEKCKIKVVGNIYEKSL